MANVINSGVQHTMCEDVVDTVSAGRRRFWMGFVVGAVVSPLLLGAAAILFVLSVAMNNNGAVMTTAARPAPAVAAVASIPVVVSFPPDEPRFKGDRGFAEVTNQGAVEITVKPVLRLTKEQAMHEGALTVLRPGETKRIEFLGEKYFDRVSGSEKLGVTAFSKGDIIRIECDGHEAVQTVVP